MKKIPGIIILTLLISIVTVGNSCVFEEKVVEVVITDELSVTLNENSHDDNFVSNTLFDYSAELDNAIADNDLDRSDIISCKLVSASYEVTDFANTHDWKICGSVSLTRQNPTDGPEPIIGYTSQSISEALGNKTPAILNSAGVTLFNRAFADYLDGGNPIMQFTVNNACVIPLPNNEDPIVFDWKICIVIHLVVKQEIKIPDPF
ncbi:hypothetical protein J7M07_09340 [bacterium]|nr:hypothetical protein [bacterium]